MRRGCIDYDATHDLYLMSGVYFKNAVDEDGNKVPAGLPRRDPWVVTQPVAHAVSLLERLHDEDLLFTHRTDPCRIYVTRRSGGAARNSQVVGDDIHRFIAFVDHLCNHHDIDPIPPDPHGLLTITRFRRTLAWFIRRRPRGLVAASIQYGHVHTRMIQGYAGAYDSGFPDELAFEDFLGRLEQFAADEQALDGGEHVSGPASQSYRQRVHAANQRFARLNVSQLAIEAAVPRWHLTHQHVDLKEMFQARIRSEGTTPAPFEIPRRRSMTFNRRIGGSKHTARNWRSGPSSTPTSFNCSPLSERPTPRRDP